MATGILNLPYSMPPVSPFDVITSQAENERIANIESLADGTGIGDGAITSDKLDFTTFPSNSSWDSGWINVTFQNGYSDQNGTTVSYRKIGGVVYLRGQSGKTTLDTAVMFTLPIGYRPALDSVHTCPSAATNTGKLAINPNGEVRCAGTPASGNYVALDVVNFVPA